jgi:hypothetical protein
MPLERVRRFDCSHTSRFAYNSKSSFLPLAQAGCLCHWVYWIFISQFDYYLLLN